MFVCVYALLTSFVFVCLLSVMGLRVKIRSLENLSESQIEELVIIQVETRQRKTLTLMVFLFVLLQ